MMQESFLNYEGLSYFLNKIKNIFQPKKRLFEINIDNENQITFNEDINILYEYLNSRSDSKNYNIDFTINMNDLQYYCNNITILKDSNFTILIDFNQIVADDLYQTIGHLRICIDSEGNYESYYNEQEHEYSDEVILTGIKTIPRFYGFDYLINNDPTSITEEERIKVFNLVKEGKTVATMYDNTLYIGKYNSSDNSITFISPMIDEKIAYINIAENGQHGGYSQNFSRVKQPIIQNVTGSSHTISNIHFGEKYKIESPNGISSLTLLNFENDSVYNNNLDDEVIIEWDCSVDDMTISVPFLFGWVNDEPPIFKENWHYQLSITRWFNPSTTSVRYQGVCIGFPCASI